MIQADNSNPIKLIITLRAARVNRGFTVNDVAQRVGKCSDTIRRYEIDSTDIPRDLSIELINLYAVPADNIFFGKESSFTGFEPRQKNRKGS